MAEEKVEKVEAVSVSAEADKKNALIGFILAVAGFAVGAGWIVGGIASIVLGALSLKKRKAGINCQANPHRVFNKVTLPVGIVDIVWGAFWTVWWTVALVLAIVAAIQAA